MESVSHVRHVSFPVPELPNSNSGGRHRERVVTGEGSRSCSYLELVRAKDSIVGIYSLVVGERIPEPVDAARSGDDLRDQRSVNIGETHVAAVEPVGEPLVIHPQQVQ